MYHQPLICSALTGNDGDDSKYNDDVAETCDELKFKYRRGIGHVIAPFTVSVILNKNRRLLEVSQKTENRKTL